MNIRLPVAIIAGMVLTALLPAAATATTVPEEHVFRLHLRDTDADRQMYAAADDADAGAFMELIWIAGLAMWVGRYEITNAQYNRYDMSHRPLEYFGHNISERRQPVVQVSWLDADNYAAWLNRNFHAQLPPGYAFRLPYEREWEIYAAAEPGQRYPWGNDWPPPGDWNYRGEEGIGLLYRIFEQPDYIRGHNDGFIVGAPVEASGRNARGLYGVGGNVWEWCADWFGAERRYRVLRGGGWNNSDERFLRLDHRGRARPEQKNAMVGFRMVLAPLEKGRRAEP